MAKLKQITVQGTTKDKKVALWERHEDHDGGEAFVVNDGKSYTVAETKEVRKKIAEGLLTTDVVKEEDIPEKTSTPANNRVAASETPGSANRNREGK